MNMNRKNHLPSFNPLNNHSPLTNIVRHGGNKIQHPVAGYSNNVSQNVEGMHKQFTAFQKNLKDLVMLYKTRHQLMESLNENGLYTAKCYNEMLDDTPLASIVVPRGKYKYAGEDKAQVPSAPEVESFISAEENERVGTPTPQSKTFQERLSSIDHVDDIDTTEYPDSGVVRERLEPDEGSLISKDLSKNISPHEPEGAKASIMMSVKASDASHLATVSDVMKDESRETDTKKDPPSAYPATLEQSIAAGNKTESTDPPCDGAFSEDKTQISVEKNPNWDNDVSSNSMAVSEDNFSEVGEYVGEVNVIVDDDEDSFTNANVPLENRASIENGTELAKSSEKDEVEKGEFIVEKENRDDETVNKYDGNDEPNKIPNSPLISNSEMENSSTSSHVESGSCSNGDENTGNEDQDYLNIGNDGQLLVIKGSPKPEQEQEPSAPVDSYFDVHKAEYKEMKSRLEEHSHLVEYVETWMETVSTRVQSRYFEYGKHRNSLNHYASKVNSLLNEEEKLKEKNKQMKPKQIEKLERNQVKLTGARETHDKGGESLLMLMDEVILRSWRDAFPLLKRSISFECDFAKITFTHKTKLGKSLELLDVIAQEESVASNGRLEKIRNMNPEDIFTGSTDFMPTRIE